MLLNSQDCQIFKSMQDRKILGFFTISEHWLCHLLQLVSKQVVAYTKVLKKDLWQDRGSGAKKLKNSLHRPDFFPLTGKGPVWW